MFGWKTDSKVSIKDIEANGIIILGRSKTSRTYYVLTGG